MNILARLFKQTQEQQLFHSNHLKDEQKLMACLYYLHYLEGIHKPKAIELAKQYREQYFNLIDNDPQLLSYFVQNCPYSEGFIHFNMILRQIYQPNEPQSQPFKRPFIAHYLFELTLMLKDLELIQKSFEKAQSYSIFSPELIIDKKDKKESLLYLSFHQSDVFDFFLINGGRLLPHEYENIKQQKEQSMTLHGKTKLEAMLNFYDTYVEKMNLEKFIQSDNNHKNSEPNNSDEHKRIKI